MIYRACHDHDAWVTLTDAEYAEAVDHGRSLYWESQADPRVKDRREVDTHHMGERVQILGAVAECAGAKVCGLPWPKYRNTFKQADLAHNIEVRLVGCEHYGLRIKPTDHPTRRVLGVIIPKGKERERYRIPGWINAVYGQKKEWLIDPGHRQRPLYVVPQDRLYALQVLLNLIARDRS